MNIKPEQLKALAIRVGKMNVHIKDNVVLYELPTCKPHPRCIVEYSPIKFESLAMELVVKYKIDVLHFTDTVLARCVDEDLSETFKVERESINEAVTLAAIAMEEGSND